MAKMHLKEIEESFDKPEFTLADLMKISKERSDYYKCGWELYSTTCNVAPVHEKIIALANQIGEMPTVEFLDFYFHSAYTPQYASFTKNDILLLARTHRCQKKQDGYWTQWHFGTTEFEILCEYNEGTRSFIDAIALIYTGKPAKNKVHLLCELENLGKIRHHAYRASSAAFVYYEEFFTIAELVEMRRRGIDLRMPYDQTREKPIPVKVLRYLFGLGELRTNADLWAIIKLARLFGNDVNAVKQYGVVDVATRHDLGDFDCSALLEDSAGWAKLLAKKPTMRKYLKYCLDVKEQLGGRLPKNVNEWMTVVEKLVTASSDKLSPEHARELNDILLKYDIVLAQHQVDAYAELFNSPVKLAEFLPYINIEHKGIRMRKLDADDILGPIIGEVTNCCQHLYNASYQCAIDAWNNPFSAVYVFESITSNKIVAETFAVRTTDNLVSFDSIEGRKHVDAKVIAELLVMADRLMVGKLGIVGTGIGDCTFGLTVAVSSHYPVRRKNVRVSTIGGHKLDSDFMDMCQDKPRSNAGNSELTFAEIDSLYMTRKLPGFFTEDKILDEDGDLEHVSNDDEDWADED